jgi:hypothetical protein
MLEQREERFLNDFFSIMSWQAYVLSIDLC